MAIPPQITELPTPLKPYKIEAIRNPRLYPRPNDGDDKVIEWLKGGNYNRNKPFGGHPRSGIVRIACYPRADQLGRALLQTNCGLRYADVSIGDVKTVTFQCRPNIGRYLRLASVPHLGSIPPI